LEAMRQCTASLCLQKSIKIKNNFFQDIYLSIYATLRTSPSKTPLTTQQQQRPSSSSSQQSTTTSTTPIILSNRSETLPQTTILSMRIPPAYTNFINPDGPLHPPRY